MTCPVEHNHAWGYSTRTGKTTCTPACPLYFRSEDALDILRPGRVPPRECIRAARDALTKAYGISDSRLTWPFMLEALDWLRRGLEQVAEQITGDSL